MPLLPDEVVEILRQLINDIDTHQFQVGDFICEVLDEYPLEAHRIWKERTGRTLYSHIINQMADRTGADRSTLRDRHNMARFFPPDIRVEYDMLTYHQLRACKYAGDKWREYAEWAVSQSMPAPVAVIRAKIKADRNEQPAEWERRWQRLLTLARLIAEDKEASAGVRRVCQAIVKGANSQGLQCS